MLGEFQIFLAAGLHPHIDVFRLPAGQRILVHEGNVIGVDVVLEEALPVGIHLMHDLARAAHVLQPVRSQRLDEAAEMLRKRVGPRLETHEDESAPGPALDLGQAELVLVAIVDQRPAVRIVVARCSDQMAIEAVAPEMIGAAEGLAIAGAFGDLRTAMAAGIGEDAHLHVFAAHDEQRDAQERHAMEIACIGDDLFAPHQVPAGQENALLLSGKEALGGVTPKGSARMSLPSRRTAA